MESLKTEAKHRGVSYIPKVNVQRHNSLFIINYSDVPPGSESNARGSSAAQITSRISQFNVYIYIDIPTIDYYTDELTDNRLSKFNKKFKLHLLRESIYKSLTNGNDQFWDDMMMGDDEVKTCTISVSSSGSLRYVETTKFLMEKCYERLAEFIKMGRLVLKYKLEVSPTSHKWFTTFLNKNLVSMDIIEFVETGSYLKFSEDSSTPFKEYYAQLNSKFTSKNDVETSDGNLDSISIITNLTGVKALLTILSDRPLTSYILQDSIDALHDNGLTKKHSKESMTDASEEDTHLKRESSSLLSFQNSLVTSNKDKSVRVRSLSLNRKLHRGQGPNSEELSVYKTPSRDTGSSSSSLHQTSPGSKNLNVPKSGLSIRAGPQNIEGEYDVKDGEEGDHEDGDEEEDEEEEDEEEDEEDGDNDSDDGISFSVPSKLSRSGSYVDISNPERPGRNGRFRSLSLMDPALHVPFTERGASVPLDPTEDDTSSVDGRKVTNIYVGDGEFDGTLSSKRGKKKVNKSALSRQNSGNGLIPPEFYSRISSPSTSASSSNSSLQNLNMAPGTFSKWVGPKDLSNDTSATSESQPASLFDKRLIDKSFEEHRKQTSINLFAALIGGLNASNDRKPLALNFKSNKVIPPEIQILDEEDLMMSGYHNANGNFSADETSEEERESTSTVIGEEFNINALDSTSSNNLNRKPANENETSNNSPKVIGANLDLQLYGSDGYGNKENAQEANGKDTESQENSKPKYKKAIQLDLYGDDDLDNMGGWILGGNAR